ncbi:delta-60 repeat domain-containing protein, partial [Colwellia chukchiensis]
TLNEDSSLPGTLVANDVDGDTLTFSVVTGSDVSNGSLTLNSDGSFTYTPTADFFGADSFTYQVNDGNGGTANAIVNLTIQAVNDEPLVSPQTFNVDEDKTAGDAVGTVLASDKEGDTLTFSLTAGDTGLFQIDANTGAITVKGVTPLDFETTAQHSVTVTIDDNGSPTPESATAVITINVNDVLEGSAVSEVAGFGRAVLGSLELTGSKTQAKLNNAVTVASKVYFIGSVDNVDKDVSVVAYNNDGSLDTSFDGDGKKVFDFGGNEYGKAIAEIAGDLFLVFDRDYGAYTEACFLKIDATGAIVTSFADNGLRCTNEQKIIAINDAVYMEQPIIQGVSTLPSDNHPAIVAVGKIQDNGSDDTDTLIIRVDENGSFKDFTPLDGGDSEHIRRDVSAANLDDEATTLYNPHNVEIMLAGNVERGSESDIFAWILNPKNSDLNYDNFNTSQPLIIDVSGNNLDDKVHAIGGENFGGGGHTAHIAGSTINGGEQDAFIIELDSFAAYVPSFGTNGIAIYDVDGTPGTGTSEFTGYVYDYGNDDLYLTGNLFDGTNSQLFSTRIFKADGSVDSANYGVNGYQVIDYAGNNAYALSMSQGSGQEMWAAGYVESGSDTNMIISAFDSSGDAYNGNDFVNGKNTLAHSSAPSDDTVAQVIQIQVGAQSGKFLVTSTANDGVNSHIVLTRFTSAGLLDTSFDTDGHKQLKIGTSAEVKGVFELADGKFIVYGTVTEATVNNGFIARIEQNGILDSTFANSGIYTTAALGANNIHFNQVKADSLGNIIAVGNYDIGSKSALVLRLTAAGAIDTSFNSLGYVVGANTDDYSALEIDGSDNIYAGGNRNTGSQDMLLIKYLTTGAVDSTFNSNAGELVVDVAGGDNNVEFIGFDSSNNLYLVGNDLVTLSDDRIAVVKISSTGVLDNSFSSDGKASLSMAPITADSGMTSAAIDSNDNIVVVGFSDALGSRRHMIGRITPTGNLDNVFDFNGYARIDTCSNTAQLTSLILLNNSSFIVAGQCYVNGTEKKNIDVSHYQLN